MRAYGLALILWSGLTSGCDSGGSDGGGGDNPLPPNPPPPQATCVEKQRSILERSGWNLTGGLGAVIDALLANQSTTEELPVCTEAP